MEAKQIDFNKLTAIIEKHQEKKSYRFFPEHRLRISSHLPLQNTADAPMSSFAQGYTDIGGSQIIHRDASFRRL